jgi:predicted acylesterase/phospholipase RssA
MPNFGKLMTGLQIGGGIMGGLATVSVTKSLLDEAIEIAPYVLGGTVMIGSLIIIVKFA